MAAVAGFMTGNTGSANNVSQTLGHHDSGSVLCSQHDPFEKDCHGHIKTFGIRFFDRSADPTNPALLNMQSSFPNFLHGQVYRSLDFIFQDDIGMLVSDTFPHSVGPVF